MDLLLAICQGLGLAIAAGLVIGVVLPPIMPGWGVIAGAAPLGILAAAAPLNGADEALWPALPVGLIGAGVAAAVSREVAAGAARREQGPAGEQGAAGALTAQAPPAIMAWIVLAAVLIAVLSIFVPPAALLALLALVWLALARRRREQRKHEGLRVLR